MSQNPQHIINHLGEEEARFAGAVIPPIVQSSLFVFPDVASREGNYRIDDEANADTLAGGGLSNRYDYTRVCNPTTDLAEKKIAALEGGEAARCFGSGMGAVSAAILSCVKAGDHIIAPETVYGPTRLFFEKYLPRFGISTTLVNGSRLEDFSENLKANTTLIFLESPSSVVMLQQDLTGVAQLAKAHGASTVIDNSWASPLFQKPLLMGIDLSVHSATKYLGGHSDIIAGVVIGSNERLTSLSFNEGCLLGSVLDPFAAWLLVRGLRTLPVRMRQHQETSREIALRLEAHPKVRAVHYPGVKNDLQADLTRKQLTGTSGLLSFALNTQTKEAGDLLVNSLQSFSIGCSWGGFENLALPMSVPGSFVGVPESRYYVVRISIGLETVEDIWCDLERALEKV